MLWLGLVRNVMHGRQGLTRDVLLDAVAAAGGTDGRTYLTTGNVTFEASGDGLPHVVDRLEDALEHVLGRREICAVRSVAWLRTFVAHERFADFADDEWETEVAFLRHDSPAIEPGRIVDLRRTVLVEVTDREALTARPRSGGARPHVNRLLEGATGSPSTARGWSTLQRIAVAAPPQ